MIGSKRAVRVTRLAVASALVAAAMLSAAPAAHGAFGVGFVGKFNVGGRRVAVIRPGQVTGGEQRWAGVTRDGKSHFLVRENGVAIVTATGAAETFLTLPESTYIWRTAVAESPVSGDIYVTQSNSIYQFKRDGTPVRSWGGTGTGNGKFTRMGDIAVDSKGIVFVGDGFRVQKFSASGAYLGKWGSKGTTAGKFRYGADALAVDRYGNVYVFDYVFRGSELGGTPKPWVLKFTTSGRYLGKIDGRSTPKRAFEGWFDLAVGADGRLFVADYYGNVVYKFLRSGRFEGRILGPNQYGGPTEISVDKNGYLYVLGDSAG